MKKSINFIFSKFTALVIFITLISVAVLTSCIDDESGIPKISIGTPVITRVYLLDTSAKRRDSSIVGSEPFRLIVINGQNIGGVKAAYFNGFPTTFNPTYNTNENLIITVPGGAPVDSTGIGAAFNKIRLVTPNGEATFNFKLIAKPALYSTDKITFGADRGDITLKGKNLADVSKVVFTGTNTVVNIISRTKDKIGNEAITLKFPTTTVGQTTLDVTNSSGTTTTTNLQFVNADVALKIFTEGFGQSWEGGSWSGASTINSQEAYAGNISMSQRLNGGSFHQIGFNNWSPSVPYSADYTHLTFAIKGGAVDTPLWVETNTSSLGYGQKYIAKNAIIVPAKVWTYFKIPIQNLDFWVPGKTLSQLALFARNIPATNDVYLLDDVMLVKK